ncbi:hypothetical protein DFQ27_007577 [Actinomortierella ambigua]|uniref:Mitochondrial import inner membrane translocase subunit TIM16 n=1 Tax=Actinomortierella ambigua TaxID=1343610 RepID=A0A9P6QGC8_9FUNG|nr:hypothetical protein DFQ27_007577 [Actinomortierella ambigua]
MAGRLIAQIIVMGSQIVGKAFMEAYRQAAANAAKNGGQQAARGGGSGGSKAATMDALTRKTGLSMDEAMNILNITKEADLAKLSKNYEHLFKVNDKASGGSFYLQSKVVRAKERIEMEWVAEGKMKNPSDKPGGKGAETTADKASSSSQSSSSNSSPSP